VERGHGSCWRGGEGSKDLRNRAPRFPLSIYGDRWHKAPEWSVRRKAVEVALLPGYAFVKAVLTPQFD
jgi:hypothetical protein